MRLTLDIPDSIAQSLLSEDARMDRCAIEHLAIEAYRLGKLSRGQVAEALGIDYYETEKLLKKNHAFQPYTAEEYRVEADALAQFVKGHENCHQ